MTVDVVVEGEERPPAGAPIHVQILDTSLADAPSEIVAAADAAAEPAPGGEVGSVRIAADLENGSPRRHYTARVHIDVDGDGRVSRGDFVTTVSHPVEPAGETHVRAVVRKVS